MELTPATRYTAHNVVTSLLAAADLNGKKYIDVDGREASFTAIDSTQEFGAAILPPEGRVATNLAQVLWGGSKLALGGFELLEQAISSATAATQETPWMRSMASGAKSLALGTLGIGSELMGYPEIGQAMNCGFAAFDSLLWGVRVFAEKNLVPCNEADIHYLLGLLRYDPQHYELEKYEALKKHIAKAPIDDLVNIFGAYFDSGELSKSGTDVFLDILGRLARRNNDAEAFLPLIPNLMDFCVKDCGVGYEEMGRAADLLVSLGYTAHSDLIPYLSHEDYRYQLVALAIISMKEQGALPEQTKTALNQMIYAADNSTLGEAVKTLAHEILEIPDERSMTNYIWNRSRTPGANLPEYAKQALVDGGLVDRWINPRGTQVRGGYLNWIP